MYMKKHTGICLRRSAPIYLQKKKNFSIGATQFKVNFIKSDDDMSSKAHIVDYRDLIFFFLFLFSRSTYSFLFEKRVKDNHI